MNNTCAIILAGGKGTRMKSKKPKVLSEILFKPMLGYVIEACNKANVNDICVVTGFKYELVEEYLSSVGDFSIARQLEQKGTGHAVMMAKDFLLKNKGKDVLVLCGDAPLITHECIENSYKSHIENKNAITVVTACLEDAGNYGRICRNDDDTIKKIVERKDCTEEEVLIKEINSGVYWFNVDNLLDCLDKLTTNNSQGEYYLTDTLEITINSNKKVSAFVCEDTDIILGANSRKDLFELNEKMRLKVIDKHFENGVEFISLDGVYISPDAKIGCDTVIYPNTIIKENVVIGEDCKIGPSTLIQDSVIDDRVSLNQVQCYKSKVHHDTDIGPFVHIRPNSEIDHHVHIGDFVEVKNSFVGAGTGISHLTYVGDSDVGKNVNFGCGVVTVNYDGVNKHRCTIKDGAFIGCNTNLIAPVTIGENGYTGAGSTITDDVPDEALGIARAKQQIKKDFSTKKLAGRRKKV